MGKPGVLEALFGQADVADVSYRSIEGTGRFDSIDQWVTTEVRGWTLSGSVGTGVLGLWDGRTGALVGTFVPGSDGVAIAASFVGVGSTVLVAGADGSTHRWDSDPATWLDFACAVAGRDLTPEEWQEALGDRPYQEVCFTG